jgi:hypothetical protein
MPARLDSLLYLDQGENFKGLPQSMVAGHRFSDGHVP